jgi:hypothetical protein
MYTNLSAIYSINECYVKSSYNILKRLSYLYNLSNLTKKMLRGFTSFNSILKKLLRTKIRME